MTRRFQLNCCVVLSILSFAIGLIVLALGWWQIIDLGVRNWCDAHRPEWAFWAARVANFGGQGGLLNLLAVAATLWLGWYWRSWRAAIPLVTAFTATYLIIGGLKVLSDRPGPHASIEHPELLWTDINGQSFPSGHVINSIVWLTVIALLLQKLTVVTHYDMSKRFPHAAVVVRTIRVALPFIVTLTTVYLSYHWLSDSLLALPLGFIISSIVIRITDWDWESSQRRQLL